jgi:tetratricopeptide (TPR) repeat protein
MEAAWTTVRVFISSTFRDMHAERDHLVRVVFPELAERMAARRLHLRPVDLRWGVLEEEDSLEVCLDVIEECRPFFVGLLGERYGTVVAPAAIDRDRLDRLREALDPAGRARLDAIYPLDPFLDRHVKSDSADEAAAVELLERAGHQEAGRSITAMEVFRGVLDDPGTRMVRFFYFRDPAVTREIAEPWRSEFVEDDPAAAARLAALKARIAEAGPEPRMYGARWDPSAERLVDLESFGRRVLEDLWAAIDARHPAGAAPTAAAADPERAASEAFLEERARLFAGRHGLMSELWHFAWNRADGTGGPPGILCVTGAPGSGKSALLARFASLWRGHGPGGAIAARFVGAGPGSTNVRRLLAGLWRELAAGTGVASEPPDDFEDLVRALPALLDEAAAAGPVVVVFDGLDQLEPLHDARSLRWLPETLPPRVAVVLSALDGDVLDAVRRRRPSPTELEVGPLSRDEAGELVELHLADRLRKLSPEQTGALLDRPGADNPLWLRVALEELGLVGRYETLGEQIAALPGDGPELFQAVLERVEGDHGRELVRGFLSLVAVGRGGQPEEDLRRMLRPPDSPRLPDLVWTRLLRSMGPWLVRRDDMVDLYHRQLREAVHLRYLAADGGRSAHARTADHLGARGLDYDRALAERAWHLFHGGRPDDLYAWVEDPEFRRRKRERTGSNAGAAEDVGLALDAALARWEAGRIGRLGFLLADLHAGEGAPADPLALHRTDPAGAVAAARLLPDAARFRTLVALAHREAEIGQREAAEDRVEEALAVPGVRLPEDEAEVLARLSVDLVVAGCAAAAGLPGRALPPLPSAAATARAAAGADPRTAALVLAAAIDGLEESTKIVARDPALLAVVEVLADAVVAVPDHARRLALLDRLDARAEEVRPMVESAAATQDPIALAIAALFGMKTGSGAGFQHAVQGAVAAARVRSGDAAGGMDRLAAAIEACRGAVDPAVFAALVRALRRIDPGAAAPLYRRLLDAAGEGGDARPLASILEGLADDERTEGLAAWIAPAEGRVRALGNVAWGETAVARARAWTRAGAGSRAEVVQLGFVAALVAWNPLVDGDAKLRVARHDIELAVLTGARGPAWNRRALARLARWSARSDDYEERARGLVQVAGLAARIGEPDALARVVAGSRAVGESSAVANVLIAALDAADRFAPEAAAPVRAAALEAGLALEYDPARAQVLARAIETGDASVLDDPAVVPAEPAARRRVEAARAGALARAGRWAEARAAWVAAEPPPWRAPIGAARAAAVARAGDAAAWEALRRGLEAGDPAAARGVFSAAARACRDEARLAALEADARRRRSRWERAGFQGRDAAAGAVIDVVRAWLRLGRPDRALRALGRSPDRHGPSWPADVPAGIAGEPRGRALLVRWGDLRAVAVGPPGPWRRRLLRVAHRRIEASDPNSAWDRLASLGGLAVALARAGRTEEARAFLMAVREPAGRAAQPPPLWPASRASAYAALAHHALEIQRAGAPLGEAPRRFALAAAEAATAVTGESFRSEVCRVLTEAWTAAYEAGAPEAPDLRRRAGEMARAMAAETGEAIGGRWAGHATIARAHLDRGEIDEALEWAAGIESDSLRDPLLARATAALVEPDPDRALRTWAGLATPAGRIEAANGIARRAFGAAAGELAGAPGGAEPAGPWLGPPQPTTRGRRFRSLAPLLGYVVVAYLLALSAIAAAVAAAEGAVAIVAVVAAAWVLGAGAAWPTVAGVVRKSRRRAAAFLLSPLAAPFVVAAGARERAPDLAGRWAAARTRWEGPRAPQQPRAWESRVRPETLRRLLRSAAREAEPFDEILGAWLAAGASHAQAADAAALLPELRLPDLPPESGRARAALRRAARRVRRPLSRLRRWFAKPLSKAGVAVTLRLFRPAVHLRARREAARIERANRLAVEGGRLLNQGDPAKGEALLREAVRLAPEQPVYWNDWGVALCQLRRTDEAVAAQRRAVETGVGWPQEDWWCYNAGYTLFNAGRYAEAIELFDRVLEIAAPDSEARSAAVTARGFCRSNLGLGG